MSPSLRVSPIVSRTRAAERAPIVRSQTRLRSNKPLNAGEHVKDQSSCRKNRSEFLATFHSANVDLATGSSSRQPRRDQRPASIGQICIIELVDIGANGHHTDDNMSTHTTFLNTLSAAGGLSFEINWPISSKSATAGSGPNQGCHYFLSVGAYPRGHIRAAFTGSSGPLSLRSKLASSPA